MSIQISWLIYIGVGLFALGFTVAWWMNTRSGSRYVGNIGDDEYFTIDPGDVAP